MIVPMGRVVFALLTALSIYYLMPAIAVLFYELYHVVHLEPVYWGYSGFKLADYYLGVWGYKLHVSVGAALVVLLVPMLFGGKKSKGDLSKEESQ